MGAIEHAVTRIIDEHPLQSPGKARRLAVAKDDDYFRARWLVGKGTGRDDAQNACEENRSHQEMPRAGQPSKFEHGLLHPRSATKIARDSRGFRRPAQTEIAEPAGFASY
jgi:hypothetical protein